MRPETEPDDRELMRRACEGDVEACADLVQRHKGRIRDFLYRLCWDEDLAEDGAQETFVRLWLHRHRYAEDGRLINYLFTIARNWWLNHRREMASAPRIVPLEEQLGPAGREVLHRMIRAAEPAETVAMRNYQLGRVRAAMMSLPEEQRMVLILGHLEDLPYEHVAQIMDIPVGTVKSRMYHAVRRLREMLTDPAEAIEDEM